MNILAIETSCDETACSIITTESIDTSSPNFKVLSNLVISQIAIHAEYGGVFPALAKREHAKNLVPLLEQSLQQSNLYEEEEENLQKQEDVSLKILLEREPELYTSLISFFSKIKQPKIDMIMVTHGPGLAPALWVGVNFARALAQAWNISIIPVNHMEGHITSILLKQDYLNQENALLPLSDFQFPLISLLISGGHTQLVLVKNWGEYEIIGETIDDAVGEAFDKVARMLGMEYPGGPKISLAAKEGKINESIVLPRPMIHSGDYRFSFSGLKTAVRYLIEDLKKENKFTQQIISDIAREFEYAAAEVLIKKTSQAIEEYNAHGLIIAGGVSANTFITESFKKKMDEFNIPLFLPEKNLCGDNALMIASAGFIQYWKHKEKATVLNNKIEAIGNLKL